MKIEDVIKMRNGKLMGVVIYRICTKCGKIKRHKYISKEQWKYYNWSTIHCYAANEKTVVGYLNTDIQNLINNWG